MTQEIQRPEDRSPFALPAHSWMWGLFALILLAGLGVVGYRWATTTALATLTEYSGSTDRDLADSQGDWFEAETRDEFFDGDGARTKKESEAHFRLTPGARLTLRPASQIRFRKRNEGKGSIGLTVEVGEADVTTKNERFTINSQFGDLIIDRNSRVRLSRDGATMKVSVELGTLTVGDPQKGRSFEAGQAVVLEIGGVVLREELGDEPVEAEEPEEEELELPEGFELDPGDGIPNVDLVVPGGQSFVVHDPSPPTAVGFRFGDVCKGPARLTLGKLSTEGMKQGNLSVPSGSHEYRIECLVEPEGKIQSGQVRVLFDSGMKPLPQFTPSADIAADGRKYTVLYQQRLPRVNVTWPAAPKAESYTLTVNGTPITSKRPSYSLRSGTLGPGTHRVVFSANTTPKRQSRTTTITVRYDHQAPKGRISGPPSKFDPTTSVPVEGQALPGWTVSLDGEELELDKARRFSHKVQSDNALAVTFSHPKHGIHYYLRRPRGGSP